MSVETGHDKGFVEGREGLYGNCTSGRVAVSISHQEAQGHNSLSGLVAVAALPSTPRSASGMITCVEDHRPGCKQSRIPRLGIDAIERPHTFPARTCDWSTSSRTADAGGAAAGRQGRCWPLAPCAPDRLGRFPMLPQAGSGVFGLLLHIHAKTQKESSR